MKTVPLILAGGKGERFWPLSRSSMPKQLLALFSHKTMIEETLARMKSVCSPETRPLVITGRDCAAGVRRVLGNRIACDIIVEPAGKNTAPAIGCAAAWIRRRYGDAVMVVVSADHAIAPVKSFVKVVRRAVTAAKQSGALVVFGVRPARPDTGYGYIRTGKTLFNRDGIAGYDVRRFVEKPSQHVAERYLKSGAYLWNSGMFVWKASVILSEIQRHMPDLHALIARLEKKGFSRPALDEFYSSCVKESIDYGVMEKSSRIIAVCGDFFWDDIGSWDAISRVHPQNSRGTVAVGTSVFESDCTNSIVYNSSGSVVAALGLDNIVLVVTPDAVMAVARPLLPDIKKYLGLMKEKKFPAGLF